jgi:hypothetical protein
VTVNGLPGGSYRARLARVDAEHSNILAGYPADRPWPDAQLWQRLRERDRLAEEDLPGTTQFDVAVPQPGVARLRLTPEEGSR